MEEGGEQEQTKRFKYPTLHNVLKRVSQSYVH